MKPVDQIQVVLEQFFLQLTRVIRAQYIKLQLGQISEFQTPVILPEIFTDAFFTVELRTTIWVFFYFPSNFII